MRSIEYEGLKSKNIERERKALLVDQRVLIVRELFERGRRVSKRVARESIELARRFFFTVSRESYDRNDNSSLSIRSDRICISEQWSEFELSKFSDREIIRSSDDNI